MSDWVLVAYSDRTFNHEAKPLVQSVPTSPRSTYTISASEKISFMRCICWLTSDSSDWLMHIASAHRNCGLLCFCCRCSFRAPWRALVIRRSLPLQIILWSKIGGPHLYEMAAYEIGESGESSINSMITGSSRKPWGSTNISRMVAVSGSKDLYSNSSSSNSTTVQGSVTNDGSERDVSGGETSKIRPSPRRGSNVIGAVPPLAWQVPLHQLCTGHVILDWLATTLWDSWFKEDLRPESLPSRSLMS